MAATKAQRIGIWVMAVFMAVGTIGSVAAIVLANQNDQSDQARIDEMTEKYQAAYKEYQQKLEDRNAPFADAEALSAKYFDTFSQFEGRPASFDASSVTELTTEDLIVGTGAELGEDSAFVAYYIGWNPDGKVFDGSFNDGALKAPYTVEPGSVIEGWTKGAVGMKVGGVRELSIPSSLAYGPMGSGEDIGPDTPIKFVVMVIAKLDPIKAPEAPKELLNYYQKGRMY